MKVGLLLFTKLKTFVICPKRFFFSHFLNGNPRSTYFEKLETSFKPFDVIKIALGEKVQEKKGYQFSFGSKRVKIEEVKAFTPLSTTARLCKM